MTIAAPPIEPSEQFLGAKSQPREFVSALRRGITADPIAINGINLAAVEARRRFRVHFTMWEADHTGDVAGDRRIAAARVDHGKVYVVYCDGIGCNASTKSAYKLARLGFRTRSCSEGSIGGAATVIR